MALISEIILEDYYNLLKDRLRTGTDRITPNRFFVNKARHLSVIQRKSTLGTYRFTKLKSFSLPSGREVFIPTIRDRILIEFLKDRLKSKYRIRYHNRESIIKSIVQKLGCGMPFFVVRLDIKNFFPSIPQHKLLGKLKSSSLLSHEEYILAKNVIKLANNNGLPPGLSISNVLSEVYLESFDRLLKRIHPRVNYYYRFVDDIFLLFNGSMTVSEQEKLKEDINLIFQKYGLNVNTTKEIYLPFCIKTQNQPVFEYLGYRFGAKNNHLVISIAQSKLQKIYNRIDFCFQDFETNSNLPLLIERLKYLTSKKRSEKKTRFLSKDQKLLSKTKQFYFGTLENYKEVNKNHEVWEQLDKYIRLKVKRIKHLGLIPHGAQLRQLNSCSFQRFLNSVEIYKIDNLTVDKLANLIFTIDPTTPLTTLQTFSKSRLLYIYFNLVDIR